MMATAGDEAGGRGKSGGVPAVYEERTSVLNPCPICLDSIKDEAYLDQCFHKFCHPCILRWSNRPRPSLNASSCPSFVECPLCKRENYCIVFGFNGDFFQKHHIDKGKRSFMTEAHKFRLLCYSRKQGEIFNHYDVNKYWISQRYLRHNVWLEFWIRREIQALIQEDDVNVILHHILGVLEAFLRKYQQERVKHSPHQVRAEWQSLMSDAARRFLHRNTDRFVNEVELFLVSGLNITAYDKVCSQFLGLETSGHMNERPQTPTRLLFDGDFDEKD